MQAIILAAGMGRRLGEHTKDNTKCMVEVNGVRLIDRVLNQLSAFELDRVIIVVGYKGQNLIDHVNNSYEGSLKIEFVNNPIYDKTNNIYSLSLVKDRLEEDDTLLLESDLIFEDSLLHDIVSNPYPNLALVAKYESWMDGTVVRLDEEHNIVNFIPRKAFKYSEVESYYKTVNIYKFSKEFSQHKYVPFLDAYSKVVGNNDYYEQVLRIITFLDKPEIKALPIGSARWYEIDDVQDLDTASSLFLSSKERLKNYSHRFGGYWRFPSILDYCLLVNPYFPPQRLVDEMKANFEELLYSYPSGMGINSMLGGKYFGIRGEYVAVGNGAAELIKSLMENSTGKVGVIYPTFEEYPNRLSQERIEPFIAKGPLFAVTAEELKSYYSDKDISMLLLVNPANPSGQMLSKTELLDLQTWTVQRNITLVVDESFVDFAEGYPDNSLLRDDILESSPNLIVLKSISKSYGVPGLRLGVLATSNLQMVQFVRKNVAIWNINSFAEFYLQIFNKYEYLYKEGCLKFQKERSRFYSALQQVAYLDVLPSQANYFLCKVKAPYTAEELTEKLLDKHNILAKNLAKKRGLEDGEYIRIAIKSTADNDKLVQAFLSLMP